MTVRRRRVERLVSVHELPLLVGLVITWMALWQTVSWMSLVSGLVVAIVAMRVFYLPPVELAGRLNLWAALRYLGFFFVHLALASFEVAWYAVRPKRPPRSGIIAIELRTKSDFILTLVGITISLIPGSLVVEVDRFGSVLYLHVLNAATDTKIEHMRRQVSHIEELLIRAVGSREELEGRP